MDWLELFLLAIALAVDAFIVSFSYGLIIKKQRGLNACKLAAAVGAGQFIMPIIGWLGTLPISRYVDKFDHWLVFLVFTILGLNIIVNALSGAEEKFEKKLTLPVLLMLGTATSIDALVTGVSLYFAKAAILQSAVTIGMTTFVCSVIGFNLNYFFKKIPYQKMEIGAGIILILLGGKVLCEHLCQL